MKTKSVKLKIQKLVKTLGSKKKVAQKLNIAVSYVYKLEQGYRPGGRLYTDICKLYDNCNKLNEIIDIPYTSKGA